MARRVTKKRGVSGKPTGSIRRSMRIKNNRDMADLLSGMTSIKIESPKKKKTKRTEAGKKAGRKKTRRMSINNKRSLAKKYWMQIRGDEEKPRNKSMKHSTSRKYKPATMTEIENLMNKLRM